MRKAFKIKRIVYSAIALAIVSFYPITLKAQNIMGAVIAGFNTTQVDGDEVYGYHKFGFNVGVAAIIPLSEKFSISIETLYNQKGSYQKPRFLGPETGEYKLVINYADIPVLIHYEDKETLTFGTGFSYGRLTSNFKEMEHGVKLDWTKTTFPYDKDDINWLFDFRFRMRHKLWFNFRYAYSIDKIRTRFFSKTGETRQQYNNVLTLRAIYIINDNSTPPPKRKKKK